MLDTLIGQIQSAQATRRPLVVLGCGSKSWHAAQATGQQLVLADYRGIVDYQPTERVVTARAGTRLTDLQAELARHGQMLAAEPPTLGGQASLGGALACGWSGPRRPWAGALRDQVLGCTIINGQGQLLRFGGQVMKNVAGFDLSRLMVGSFGTLGVIVEASLRLAPRPETELVLRFELDQADAIRMMNHTAGSPFPLSGAAWERKILRLRLSGHASAVAAAAEQLGGDPDPEGLIWFARLADLRHPLFADPGQGMALWRLSLPSAAPPLLPGYPQLLDWGGALRWLVAPLEQSKVIRAAVEHQGGHATCLRQGSGGARLPRQHPLPPALAALQKRLKQAFDPAGILNPGAPLPGL
ncbi:glycolate oxidase subunit GlcE [Chitinimonas lacunae]|uniref:Glycolate oxidase subunit GlcE n=1 Tax=Chitinimonas lacunae TaxID=1963018 RepID=A0ABV8MSF6_9NEIS